MNIRSELLRFEVSADWLNTGCAELSIRCTADGCRWSHDWPEPSQASLVVLLTVAATHPPSDCPTSA